MARVNALNLIRFEKSSALFQLFSSKRLKGGRMCSPKVSLGKEVLEMPNEGL